MDYREREVTGKREKWEFGKFCGDDFSSHCVFIYDGKKGRILAFQVIQKKHDTIEKILKNPTSIYTITFLTKLGLQHPFECVNT